LIGSVTKGANAGEYVVYPKGLKAFFAALFRRVDFTLPTESIPHSPTIQPVTSITNTPTIQPLRSGFEIFKTCRLFNGEESRLMEKFYPAKAPDHESPPNQKNLDKWVNAHPQEFQSIALKLKEHLHYVTHEEFQNELKTSVEGFNRYLDSQEDKSYTIVIAGDYDKSSLWVTSLAEPFLKYPPTNIIMQYDPAYPAFIKHSKTDNFVIFDDAAYSGNQMCQFLSEGVLSVSKGKTIHPIIPFMTKFAEINILSVLEGSKSTLSSHQIMPGFAEFLTPEEQDLLIKEGNEQFYGVIKNQEDNPSGFGELVVTYFPHKIGDSYSAIEAIRYGSSLSRSQRENIRFVDEIIPPYKSENTDTP
jgi:hypothetical protein